MDLLENPDVSELIARVRRAESDDEAFAQLIDKYRPLINNSVRSFACSGGCESELEQEAVVALHKAASSYDDKAYGGVTFGLYAKICISNALKDYIRLEARRTEHIHDFNELDKIASAGNQESALIRSDSFERLLKVARSSLAELEFRVLCLTVEGYSVSDIAHRLGVSGKAVENARYRYRKKLEHDKEFLSFI